MTRISYAASLALSAAILAATVTAAEHIGRQDRIGTIEKGNAADIIATAVSPLDDVAELRKVQFVMRDGNVFKAAMGRRETC